MIIDLVVVVVGCEVVVDVGRKCVFLMRVRSREPDMLVVLRSAGVTCPFRADTGTGGSLRGVKSPGAGLDPLEVGVKCGEFMISSTQIQRFLSAQHVIIADKRAHKVKRNTSACYNCYKCYTNIDVQNTPYSIQQEFGIRIPSSNTRHQLNGQI